MFLSFAFALGQRKGKIVKGTGMESDPKFSEAMIFSLFIAFNDTGTGTKLASIASVCSTRLELGATSLSYVV